MSNFRILTQEQQDKLNPTERAAYGQDIIDGMADGSIIVTEDGMRIADDVQVKMSSAELHHYDEIKRLHAIAATISKVDNYQVKIERSKTVAEGFTELADQTHGKLRKQCEAAAQQYTDMVKIMSKAAKSRRAAKSVVDAANREREERRRAAEKEAQLEAETTAIEDAASVRKAREVREANKHQDFVLAERAKSIERQQQRQERVEQYRAERAAAKARKIEEINVVRRAEGLPDIVDPKRFDK